MIYLYVCVSLFGIPFLNFGDERRQNDKANPPQRQGCRCSPSDRPTARPAARSPVRPPDRTSGRPSAYTYKYVYIWILM